MLPNVPDKHKTKGGGTVSDFELFIAYVVNEVKKGPDEPVNSERIGNYDTESQYPKAL
jgi:hypothetical protein